MARPISPGIHHVTTVGVDADATTTFYCETLGLTQVRHEPRPGSLARLVFGDEQGTPGTLVEVLIDASAGRGRWGIGGLHHIAFGVEDEQGLLRWKRRLTDRGVRVSGPYDRGYFTSIYFTDPAGQILDIATAGPGYAIDEPSDRLGEQLVLPPSRIVRGHRDERAIAALTHPEPVPEVTPEIELQGIHHVSGITDDLPGAGAFYEQVFGLSLIKKTTNRDDPNQLHYFWANYEGEALHPHSSYTLFGWPSHWKRARPGIGQVDSVTFSMGASSPTEWQEHLEGLGFRPDRLEDDVLRFEAPDGMVLQLEQSERAESADPGRARASGTLAKQ